MKVSRTIAVPLHTWTAGKIRTDRECCVNLSRSFSRCFEPRSALGRPVFGWAVEFRDRRNAVRQDNPRLLRGRVDVNVRRNARGIVERSHPYEMNIRTCLRIIAPNGHSTVGAAPENLTLAAGTGERGSSRFAFQEFDLRRLDQSVDRESRSGLALAPCAMATMHKQRSRLEAITYRCTSAAAFHGVALVIRHCQLHAVNYRR
jgi:hypothetical protein